MKPILAIFALVLALFLAALAGPMIFMPLCILIIIGLVSVHYEEKEFQRQYLIDMGYEEDDKE